MADFYQNGIVTTMHNLRQRSNENLEAELQKFSSARPMGLILPSLFSELEGDAFPDIVDHLCEVPYLSEIVIGLDRANEEQYRHALKFFKKLPQHHRVLWNEGPRLKALDAKLQALGVAPKELGKGRNVWYCMGYTLASGKAESVALHDCDIVTYDRALLARLIYPVANPGFNYEFCKGFYSRVADGKVNGRVSRLLVTPLVKALKKTIGHNDYLEFIDSFLYPLAGEFSFRKDVLSDLRIPSDWGLEIGVLSEMHRNYASNRTCQVDISDAYDHKHQDLSLDNVEGGLSKMSVDITKAFIRKLATQGETFSTESIRTLKATYYRIALDYLEMYRGDALMNGLSLDIHNEEKAIEMFAENVMTAGQIFLDKPMDTPFIPSWSRVISAMPDVLDQLKEAVELDYQEFSE
ncbi:glycosyl transferase [Psychromonas sp. 14N.309.X.WAT.B.A12]|uniref:glycosyl transferase n=1 Tax=unclassified Psychromonas TaxID=2614957 RepID=UPI0025AF8F4B|nr:glycosyl transferase [Psychromonas sp. 14N.309.X.WAT.B.A12]MDN2663260.1 glycosyl transferase [Psychromonas sp. 14N.309.X.WAT.B.A12]